MNIKRFIDRPILSIVISVVIVVAGLIGLFGLAVEQYPDIAPPTIRVSTTYSGRKCRDRAEECDSTARRGYQWCGEHDLHDFDSQQHGSGEITIYFKQGSDGDMAAVNVQNSVSTATALLPAEVTKIGVTTRKRQNSTLMVFGLYSPDGTYDETFLTNYMNINVKPGIQRISGVGEVNVMGGAYAMRIWLKPDVMAQYGLVPNDVTAALSSQNIEAIDRVQ